MILNYANFRTPGQLIQALLDQHGWTQRVLAIILEMSDSNVNKLVSSARPVDASTALALEDVFGVPADQFLELQKSYDLAKARIEAIPDKERAKRATLFGGLPVAEMIKRGWIEADNIRDTSSVQYGLMQFFNVSKIDDIEIMPHAAKKTEVSEEASPAQLAWLYRVRSIASEMIVGRFTNESANKAIAKLKTLLLSAEEVRRAPRILAECGIRLVICEALPSAKIDGACFWLNKRSPVIGLTLRHNRIDNFWFVLRHELEHVRQRHGLETVMLDAELEGDKAGQSDSINEEERVANAAAADFCVPQEMLSAFIRKKAPLFSERDLKGFARTIKVHPGLIAGQLQHKTGDFRRFRGHLIPIRDIVIPNAVVDGWGDIYPIEKG